jgi:hypothetical protein
MDRAAKLKFHVSIENGRNLGLPHGQVKAALSRPRPEEAPTGRREAPPDDRLRAVSKDVAATSFETRSFGVLLRMKLV